MAEAEYRVRITTVNDGVAQFKRAMVSQLHKVTLDCMKNDVRIIFLATTQLKEIESVRILSLRDSLQRMHQAIRVRMNGWVFEFPFVMRIHRGQWISWRHSEAMFQPT